MYVSVQDFQNSFYYESISDLFTSTDQISGFLDDICGLIDNYCGRTFVTGNYSDTFSGNNTYVWFTREFPLLSIQSITYRTSDGTSGTVSSGDYFLASDKGMIKFKTVLLDTRFYTVNYTAGYNTIPQPIKTATMMLAKHLADAVDVGNLAWADGASLAQFKFGKFTEIYTAGNQRITGEIDNLPPTIATLLKRYRYSKSI